MFTRGSLRVINVEVCSRISNEGRSDVRRVVSKEIGNHSKTEDQVVSNIL